MERSCKDRVRSAYSPRTKRRQQQEQPDAHTQQNVFDSLVTHSCPHVETNNDPLLSFYCRSCEEEGRFFRNCGCRHGLPTQAKRTRQCMKEGSRNRAVTTAETSSITIAYVLRSSRRTPATLKTKAKGGQSRIDDFTKVESRLPHPGCRMISSGTVTPRTAKIFAAVLP